MTRKSRVGFRAVSVREALEAFPGVFLQTGGRLCGSSGRRGESRAFREIELPPRSVSRATPFSLIGMFQELKGKTGWRPPSKLSGTFFIFSKRWSNWIVFSGKLSICKSFTEASLFVCHCIYFLYLQPIILTRRSSVSRCTKLFGKLDAGGPE